MKIIALLAVLAMILVDLLGSKSSVGGPMTMMMVLFLFMLAVGIHEAWSNRRGPGGWIVNILVAILGGFVGAMLFGSGMDVIMSLLSSFTSFEGSLASSSNPLKYIPYAALAVITVFGSWTAIQLVNRMRRAPDAEGVR